MGILAALEGADAAVITAIGAVVVATIGGAFTLASSRATKSAVGTPNGHGNVIQMSERILIEVGRIHEKIDEHTEQDERNFSELNSRIGDIESLMGDKYFVDLKDRFDSDFQDSSAHQFVSTPTREG